MIYHIAPQSHFDANSQGDYACESLEREGFIHCSTKEQTIRVANAFFANASEPLLVLEIDPAKLRSRLAFELGIPPEGTTQARPSENFPHVYGPVQAEAIVGVGALGGAGPHYRWPEAFSRPPFR